MFFSTTKAAICFIALHGGPADHFSAFTKELSQNEIPVTVYASGDALKKFQDKGVKVNSPFSLEGLSPDEEDSLAEYIAKTCSAASVVITDLGHPFDIKIQKALDKNRSHVIRLAYYDNPEPYVPGGYSEIAAKVIQATQGVLFANANLATAPLFESPGKKIDFSSQKKIGIGYYPILQAEIIKNRREKEHASLRQSFFQSNGLTDQKENILVYFGGGGTNKDYLEKALPAFLSLLEEMAKKATKPADFILVLQQHPGAKAKNIDRSLVEEWVAAQTELPFAPKIVISDFNSDHAQVLADGALYYQTSMGPQFALAGIPTIIQVGHERYEDILVSNNISPSVTTLEQWIEATKDLSKDGNNCQKEKILKGLGINENWADIFIREIKNSASFKERGDLSLKNFSIRNGYLPYLATCSTVAALLTAEITYHISGNSPDCHDCIQYDFRTIYR